MNIIRLLKKYSTRQSPPDSESQEMPQSDLRLHPRYSVAQFGLFYLQDKNSNPIPVRDISYSGIAIEATDQPNHWQQTSPLEIEIANLSGRCKATLIPIRKSNPQIGYAFAHTSISTLTFLRPALEDLRLGYSLQPIAEQWRKEEYRSRNWHMMRGDGPVDLTFQLNDQDSKIIHLMMTFRQDQSYYEIRLQNNRWGTLHSIPEPGVAVRMFETPKLDLTIVERSVYILTGAHSRFSNPAFATIIENLINELQIKPIPKNSA